MRSATVGRFSAAGCKGTGGLITTPPASVCLSVCLCVNACETRCQVTVNKGTRSLNVEN